MQNKIILASKSKVRKEILDKNNIESVVEHSNVNEDIVKLSLIKERASPEIISKNLAELKANKVSSKNTDHIVLGADSVIDLNGELISKPENRKEAIEILKKLNGKTHLLISSVCISKNGSMIWNYTDKAKLTMKNFSENELEEYLSKKGITFFLNGTVILQPPIFWFFILSIKLSISFSSSFIFSYIALILFCLIQ